MSRQHYNPMTEHEREYDRHTSSSRGEDYGKIELKITEIREKSVFYLESEVPHVERSIGRSLLHASTDDRMTKYDGPLPMDMVITIRGWWIDKYNRDKK